MRRADLGWGWGWVWVWVGEVEGDREGDMVVVGLKRGNGGWVRGWRGDEDGLKGEVEG